MLEQNDFFYYGQDGLTGFSLNGVEYLYKKNIQNDIIGIYSTEGAQIAEYEYDAWGNQIVKYCNNGKFVDIEENFQYNDTSITNRFIAFKNPFRYRSYYYDFETNLYYLNSRYYDPQLGRFINADDISTLEVTKIAINGINLYAYCLNNPVNEVDENGYFLGWLLGLLIVSIVFAVVNTSVQVVSTVIQGITTGNWDWSWEKFAGAFIGGFLGGAAFVLSGFNMQVAFGVTSFTESLTTNLLTNATGKTNDSLFSIFAKSVGKGIIGFAFGKGLNKLQGITKGTNSFLAVFKSGITKLVNGTASKMSFKVMTKGIAGLFVLKGLGITSGLMNSIVNFISYLFGNKEAIGYGR